MSKVFNPLVYSGLDETGAVAGPPGPTGATGATGPPGVDGPEGTEGADGLPGSPGVAGAAGTAGATGTAGTAGPPGLDGQDGQDGDIGMPGPTGATGSTGSTGATGAPGLQGVPGFGFDGEDGEPGFPGAPGSAGATGAPGATGPAGSGSNMPLSSPYEPDEQEQNIKSETITIPIIGVLRTVEVNLGTIPRRSGFFVLVDLSSRVPGPVMMAQATGPYTGKGTRADESQMEQINFYATIEPVFGATYVHWVSRWLTRGNIKVNVIAFRG